jgi:RNA polymerase sigma factor for flagellar operon FliA
MDDKRDVARDDRRRARGDHVPEDSSEAASLWQAFWKDNSVAARNQLLVAYEPLVKVAALAMPKAVRDHWETDDLASFGFFGLLHAVERFAVDSEVWRFPRYALLCIRGAIFDELRRLDWLPRSTRRRVIHYRDALEHLSNELGRIPNGIEIALHLGVDRSAIGRIASEFGAAQLVSLSDVASDEHPIEMLGRAPRSDNPEDSFVVAEQLSHLRLAIAELPERQRVVLLQRFLAGMSQHEIGTQLGLSRSRVCEIESEAIRALRKELLRN